MRMPTQKLSEVSRNKYFREVCSNWNIKAK